LGLAMAAPLALAPAAPAAVTIGSDLVKPVGYGGGPAAPFTAVTSAIPGRPTVAPFDGVVTRWRVKASGADWGTLRLHVVRQVTAAPTFAVVRSSAPVSPGPMNGTEEFAASMPIATGELIGIESTGFVQGAPNVSGATTHLLTPSPPDAGPAVTPLLAEP